MPPVQLVLQPVSLLHRRVGGCDRSQPSASVDQRDAGVVGVELLANVVDDLFGRLRGCGRTPASDRRGTYEMRAATRDGAYAGWPNPSKASMT